MQKVRKFIIGKNGLQYITLQVQEVAFFMTSDKIVYAVMEDGRKFLVESRLSILEFELDKAIFFRVNRQYIVNVLFIKSFLPYKSGQIILDLSVKHSKEEIVVSQALTPVFKNWIYNL